MKKQFESLEDLIKWENDRFPQPEMEWTFENVIKNLSYPSHEDIIKKLVEEGYDLDDLTANGEGYRIGNHTNHGWHD